ncbi:hypothetical protein QBC35DRAFT_390495 [Podospora australis]|uniref:HD/PDEase domain-containing protein n=1 Tax=Podospora australis TaxID=1536484 RepID=A0AAN6WRB8_9PEZI|nr:hypothetical protein QBC35DRAFT_390495 [Podospora australis]
MCNPTAENRCNDNGSTGTITAAVRALVPQHPACFEALNRAKSALPAGILYHSVRVYFYATAFLRRFTDDNGPWSSPPSPTPESSSSLRSTLFIACVLHDIGLAKDYDSIPEQFEVVSADVAATLLREHKIPEAEIQEAWLAMAMHTSPGIAERVGGIVRALSLAARADFGSYPLPPQERRNSTDEEEEGWWGGGHWVGKWQLPRLEFEKELGDAVVRQQKAPGGSWPGDLVRGRTTMGLSWEGVNPEF